MLLREPLLLYFACRRGPWIHKKSRGKKHFPLNPRGIIKDIEIDSKFLAKYQLNSSKKDSHLVRVKSRKNREKSMHAVPAKYCKLTTFGKKLYLYLKRKGMVQCIEKNYSIGNNKDFVNKFVAKFNLNLTEDDEIEKINKNQRKRIDSHRQEGKGDLSLRKTNHREIYLYEKPREINDFSLTISNEVSRFLYDEIIETYSFSDNRVLVLLSKEYQTILEIIYNCRITDNEYIVAIRAKLIELTNSKIIEEDLKNVQQ